MTPDGWRETSLGEIARVEIGRTPARKEKSYWDPEKTTNNRWATIRDVKSKFVGETAEHISEIGVRHSRAQLIPTGTLLMSFKLTLGRAAITSYPMYTNEALAAFYHNNGASTEYLYYLLPNLALEESSDRAVKGRTLNKGKLRALRLMLPPLSEQRKIAAILSSIDNSIEKTQAVIDQTQVVKRGIMEELATGGLPGWHSALKKTAIASVPEEWRVLPAAKALAAKPRNGRSPRARATPPGVPTFSIAAVRRGRVDIFGNLKYVDLTDEQAKEFRIHQGDILVVRGNANEALLGRCGVVNAYPDGCIYPDILMRLIPNENFDSRYFAYLWNTDLIHSQLRAKAKTTSGTLKINQSDVSTVLLPCPKLAEQSRIVRVVKGIDQFDSKSREALSAYRHFKTALMSVLLTGELRVTPDPEPA